MIKHRIIPIISSVLLGFSTQAQAALISADFEGLTNDQLLYDGIAKYDYTSNKGFDIADTTPNTLGFYAGTSTSWFAKTDPLDSSNMTIWMNGSDNHSNPGRGMYLMRLDPTDGGTYTTGSVTINYSFRMMRDGTNANSPTDFDVKWVSRPASPNDGSDNLDMFTWDGEVTDQSFSTSGDSDTWVTVAGSITADLTNLDVTNPYTTGIRVDPTNGGFVTGSGSPGLYYVDDINVSVVPEPRVYALMLGFATLGMVFYRRRFQKRS